MTFHRVEQGSPEWRSLRLGRATASRIVDLCAKTKSGWAASRTNYKSELIFERITGKPYETHITQDMLIGTMREPIARSEYESRNDCEVEYIGFVDHPTIEMSGASADGFVGDDGLIEIKAPKSITHLGYLRDAIVPDRYMPQILWNFACNPQREWCDFISYHPDFPDAMKLLVIRVHRDDSAIAELERAVRDFLREVDEGVALLRNMYESKGGN